MKAKELIEMLEKRIQEIKEKIRVESCVRKKRFLQETYKTNEEMLKEALVRFG